MKIIELGGFQDAANKLTALSGETWSRQRAMQMWNRRASNGFPRLRTYIIHGKMKKLFNLQYVEDWYSFAAAADILTASTGEIHHPSKVYKLWLDRWNNGFPPRVRRNGRLTFDDGHLRAWVKQKE